MDISYKLRHTIDSLAQQPDQEVDVCVSSDTRSRPGHASDILLDIRTISREITHSGPRTLVSLELRGGATATIIKSSLGFFRSEGTGGARGHTGVYEQRRYACAMDSDGAWVSTSHTCVPFETSFPRPWSTMCACLLDIHPAPSR